MIVPVILAGGFGKRLWPISRSAYPKQFSALISEKTLLLQTIARCNVNTEMATPLFVGNEEHRFILQEQISTAGLENAPIILEPIGKNTAPAISIAALYAQSCYDDPVLLVLPADHIIQTNDNLLTAVQKGAELAKKDKLVVFGITPDRAETGYGYIKTSQSYENLDYLPVDEFVEKPDAQKAKEYVAQKEYYWNSGMFMFKTSTFLNEIQQYAEDIYECCQQAAKTVAVDGPFLRLDNNIFKHCRSESVDYAVMEKTNKLVLLPLTCHWSDMGSWDAVFTLAEKQANGNVVKGEVITENTKNCYLHSNNRLLATIGIENQIIIETDDAVLVANKANSQDVKLVVERLQQQNNSVVQYHTKVHRPWGWFVNIENGPGFHVKRLIINPNSALSLQLHKHRSEHWVVVTGTATVTRDEETFTLSVNQSTFVPVGCKHRLANETNSILEVIEVQTGQQLSEDDIERFDDHYGREQDVGETVAQ